MAFMAEQLQIPLAALVDAARLHKQLFDKGGNPYYTSLTSLSRAEGVRLEASRYLMFMPAQRKPEVQACGDGLLVMAAGAVRVLRASLPWSKEGELTHREIERERGAHTQRERERGELTHRERERERGAHTQR
jgi:hypothetical protein